MPACLKAKIAHAQGLPRGDERAGTKYLRAGLEPVQHAVPVSLRAVEAVAVDPAGHARNLTRRGELPERPGALPVTRVGLGGDRAQPEMIVGELAFEHVTVEDGIGVDDWPLAGVGLHRVEQDLDLSERRVAVDLAGACLGIAVPLD